MVSWAELDLISVEDLWDILEVSAVDAHNARLLRKAENAEGEG